MDWLLLFGGGFLLYFGAEWFVGGASALALRLRVPQILVGLTVVAYGTSAPEIIVGIQAASNGHGEVALGNIVGSNIANVGLILGVAALVRPALVDGTLRRRELPMLLASAAAVPLVLLDGVVGPGEALGLLLVAIGYTAWMVREARSRAASATVEVEVARDVARDVGAPRAPGSLRALAIASVRLAVLLLGGELFVGGAVSVARELGMSERLVGVTIVALGTSLPELVTSVVAARRGHSALAVGNVVGSNIFNVFLCLGAAGLAGRVATPLQSLHLDLGALTVMTVFMAIAIRTGRTISRLEGGVALGLYGAFLALLILQL